jgi:diguanylate cyclase (GGDEF)-like protein/PAS domain S-box-containing protein
LSDLFARRAPSFPARRWWRTWVVVGTVAGSLYYVLPSPAAQQLFVAGFCAAVGLLFLATTLLHRPDRPAFWLLCGAGLLIKSAGDVCNYLARFALVTEQTAILWSNVCYLATYAVFVGCLVVLVRRRDPGAFRINAIDTMIIVTNCGVVSWIFLMAPYLRNQRLPFALLAATMALPVGNVLLFGVLVALVLSSARRSRSLNLLSLAVATHLLADSVYYMQMLDRSYREGTFIDGVWLLAYVLGGAAALHPSRVALWGSRALPKRSLSRRHLALFAGAGALAPVTLIVQALLDEALDVPLVVGASFLVFFLVLLRLSDLVLDNERKVEQLEERETLLRDTEAKYRTLVERLPAIAYTCVPTTEGEWLYISPQVESIVGFTPQEVRDQGLWGTQLHPDDRDRVYREEEWSRERGLPFDCVYRLIARDGHEVWIQDRAVVIRNEAGEPVVLQGVMSDITAQKVLEERLHHQAFHDGLTGLANRALFVDRTAHALARRERHHGPLAVLFMDLDDFKTINDSLGHSVGDELLRQVAERVNKCLRESDTAARLSGDEFAVLLESADEREATVVAIKLIEALQEPFSLSGRPVNTYASIGIATASDTGDVGELLRNADAAMYAAKAKGKGTYEMFRAEMHTEALARLEMNADLQRALERDELMVHYQPIVDLETGRTAGMEALVRWHDLLQGPVPPSELIAAAEHTGLVVGIDRWVLAQACKQTALLQAMFPSHEPLYVSVNISTQSLQGDGLVKAVADVLDLTGLDPDSLVLEITESSWVRNADKAEAALAGLRRLGVRLAIDDFGTGYSSLSRLQAMPIGVLKIDKSFVDEADRADDRALIEAIVKLGDSLGLATVAEGIETPRQLEWLRRLGCRYGQGYHLSYPLPPAQLEEFLGIRHLELVGD